MYWHDVIIDSEQYTYEYFLQEDVCRLCWSRNASHEIHSNKPGDLSVNSSLSHKISDCLNLEVDSYQLNKVCSNCCKEIDRFYEFKTFCNNTDRKLREILQKGLTLSDNLINVKHEVKCEYDETNFDTDEENSFEIHEEEIEKISTSKKLKNNRKIRHKRSPTYCNICSLDLESKENLSSHNAELHGIENDGTLFKCLGCDKRFKSGKTRAAHELKFCKGLKDGYKCSNCDRYLPKRSEYEVHMKNHRHNLGTELPEYAFQCGKCLMSYKTKELLKNHMAEHAKEKNFVCDICGRVFIRQDYLYKHKLTHAGVKRHQCPHCDFRATQRSSLTVHIRKHTGERPYGCDACPQRCISSSNLRAHRRRHLGLKKYECSICNKKFGYKISLEEHISSAHVRSESHPCEHCGATYMRLRGLRRHLAAKHGKQAPKNIVKPLIVEVTAATEKNEILKNVAHEIKDGDNVLLLKHQDGDVYMV